jgi:hypothetical protein
MMTDKRDLLEKPDILFSDAHPDLIVAGQALLGISDPEVIKLLITSMNEAHIEYSTDLIFKRTLKTTKEQKQHLRKLQTALKKAFLAWHELSPAYAVAIIDCAEQAIPGESIDVLQFPDDIERLFFGISDFLERFEPPKGPPTNWALENAVRILLPTLESISGEPATVRENKPTEDKPEPSSPPAEFLVMVIRRFEKTPSITAILGMIQKVKEQVDSKMDPLSAVIKAHLSGHDNPVIQRSEWEQED